MRTDDYLIGVDVGSTSLRLSVFRADGKLVAVGRQGYEVAHPQPGFAECSAEDWWKAFGDASREALAGAGGGCLRGLAVTHQRQTFACVDDRMRPVRPAIMWYDTRCAEQARLAAERLGEDVIYRRTGSPPGRRAIYKAMWLARHEPETYARTHKILFIQDYLLHRLTGNLVTTPGVCAASGCLDIAARYRWAEDVIAACGIDATKWVSSILPGGTVAGTVSGEAADFTGLPRGLPVVLAAGDQACGNLGTGGAVPGRLGINGGTSCALQMVADSLPYDRLKRFFVEVSPTGAYIAENGVTSGGSALMTWFRDNFGRAEEERASREGRDVWEIIFDDLTREAPPGADGLMLLPYLRGANGPYWEPKARGLLFGLRTDHGKGHVVRAIIEGLAYESRFIKEGMEEAAGRSVEEVRMYGGSSRSAAWNQTFADVMGVPVVTTAYEEAPSLGAAICAGKGAGVFEDMLAAARAVVHVDRVYEPRPDVAHLYGELFTSVYLKLYEHNRELLDRLTHITRFPA